ncbi:hypothetical protein B0H10DRAFT_1944981 [Mycena sp. CBHHK59/15]|nr:hypothetical protein B0H10DRAFT_1944981 [Mycena sp. CBHHK59/15]
MPNSLQDHFWKGEKQNTTYYKNYCKACVKNQMQSVGAPLADIVTQGQAFKDGMVLRWHRTLASDLGLTILACTAMGSVLSKKDSWIAHLIGGKTACQYASAEAKADATAQRIASKKRAEPETAGGTEPPHKKQQQDVTPIQSTLTGFRRNEMPYGEAEKAAIKSQALRAIVSGGLPLGTFEDHEMRLLIGMFRTTAPAILPTGKVAGGRLLKAAAADVEAIRIKVLKAISIRGEVDDNTAILDFHTVDHHSKLFAKSRTILVERSYFHKLDQFQLILGDYFKVNDMAAVIAEDATAIISWINNHGKVRKIFDEAQKTISLDRLGKIIILAYLVANITRWTTHFIAFCRLFLLRAALQLAVLQNRSAIIAAEVGTATSTEGTNINQKDSTRLDQVLLTIAGIFLRFDDHPEPEVKKAICIAGWPIVRTIPTVLTSESSRKGDTDPIAVWKAFAGSKHLAELAEFAIVIHYIVANQAGCERTFSRTKIEQSDHRNRLGLEKIDMRTKVKGQIRSDHQRDGIYKPRKPRKNHKSTANLLADDEDPSERGRALVSSREGWRTQTAKLISDTRAADRNTEDPDSDEEADTAPHIPSRLPTWKKITLHILFGGAEKPRARKPSARVIQEEELLMQALAEELEDDVPDDGAIEIDSEDEYPEAFTLPKAFTILRVNFEGLRANTEAKR